MNSPEISIFSNIKFPSESGEASLISSPFKNNTAVVSSLIFPKISTIGNEDQEEILNIEENVNLEFFVPTIEVMESVSSKEGVEYVILESVELG